MVINVVDQMTIQIATSLLESYSNNDVHYLKVQSHAKIFVFC